MIMKSVVALSMVLVVALFSTVAWADSGSNFLMGFEAAYARQRENVIVSFVDPTLTPVALTTYDNDTYMLSDELLILGGMLGWQWRCDRVMLGVEGTADLHSITKAASFLYSTGGSTLEGTAEYDRGTIYYLTGRMGYFVTSGFMPYVRAGAQFSVDEASYQVFANPGSAVGLQSDFISSGKRSVWGFVVGCGMEFPAFIGPSTLRVEYIFSETESIVIDDGAPPILGTDKFRAPRINAIKFAWVWNFV